MTERYKAAGVDLDAGVRAVEMMKAAVRATYTPQVLADVGSFGGLFALENLPGAPVLVASIDGVGTKVKLAAQVERWESIGYDIVNHCVNDILVQNARPLFFLDYLAAGRLDPSAAAGVVAGIASACRTVGCALIGGETAEMPGVYVDGAFDVAGAVVGMVDRGNLLPRPASMQIDDALIGLPSSGPHTNGFSLIRRAVAGQDLNTVLPDGQTLIDALLAPHRCYLSEVDRLQSAGIFVKGMAHITGGGLVENVPRILPDALAARIVACSWSVPPIFQVVVNWSEMEAVETYRVLNMGIGMVVVVAAVDAEAVLALLPEAVVIGRLEQRTEESPAVQIVL